MGVAALEADHEVAQGAEGLIRDAIVQAGTQAANGVVACQLVQASRLGLAAEGLLEGHISAPHPERDRCAGAVLWVHVVGEEAIRAVNDGVELHSTLLSRLYGIEIGCIQCAGSANKTSCSQRSTKAYT